MTLIVLDREMLHLASMVAVERIQRSIKLGGKIDVSSPSPLTDTEYYFSSFDSILTKAKILLCHNVVMSLSHNLGMG